MNEYLIKITTKQSLNTVRNHIEKKYKLKEGSWIKNKYTPATYVYQLPERNKNYCYDHKESLNSNLECLRNRLNELSHKSTNVYISYSTEEYDYRETKLRMDKDDSEELTSSLVDNKLNGGNGINFYQNGFDINITDYSIERAD